METASGKYTRNCRIHNSISKKKAYSPLHNISSTNNIEVQPNPTTNVLIRPTRSMNNMTISKPVERNESFGLLTVDVDIVQSQTLYNSST